MFQIGYVIGMMKTNQLFAYNLKKLREQRNLTQEDLAELTNLHPRTISRFETAEHFCKAHTIDLLAEVLKIEVEELFKTPKQ